MFGRTFFTLVFGLLAAVAFIGCDAKPADACDTVFSFSQPACVQSYAVAPVQSYAVVQPQIVYQQVPVIQKQIVQKQVAVVQKQAVVRQKVLVQKQRAPRRQVIRQRTIIRNR